MQSPSQTLEVILADDDADDRQLFREALEQSAVDAHLTTISDGERLTSFLSEITHPPPPDIIFLDINMPRKDGKKCLKEIRSQKQFQEIPVIILTTSQHRSDIEETFISGANLFMSKSFFFENDVTILRQLFSANWKEYFGNISKESFVLR